MRRVVGTVGALGALVALAGAPYTVQSGETLSGIAVRNGVSVDELAAANGITDPDRIYAGQSLVLPGAAGRETSAPSASGATHEIAPGEHLTGIAGRYGVSVADLVNANGLADPNRIVAGQHLTIPGAAAPAAAAPSPVDRAAAGELIERIAREHGWNPAFVKALAWQESGWQMSRVSSTGAVGIMQVQPGTGTFVSRDLAGRTLDLTVPEDNVLAGVLFLDHLWDLTGGDVRLTLGGYYQGLRSMRANGVYADTERYIDNVLALKARFS